MDDGGQSASSGSCLLDVINDPKLLESFLENGAAAAAAANNAKKGTNGPSDSRPTITSSARTKKAANNRRGTVNGKKNNVSSSSNDQAKQSDQVSSSCIITTGGTPVGPSGMKHDKKSPVKIVNVPNVPSSISLQPNHSQTFFTMAGGTQAIRTSFNPSNINWPQTLQVRPQQQLMQMSAGGLPQVIQTINGQMVLTRGPSGPTLTPHPNGGGLLQLLQTPNGPQLISVPQPQGQPSVQQTTPLASSPAKGLMNNSTGGPNLSSSTPSLSTGGRTGNKQILPKPMGGSNSSSNRVQVSSHQSNSSQATPMRTVMSGLNQVPQTLSLNPSGDGSPQILLGSGGAQGPSFIMGPNGTLLLNPNSLQGLNPPLLLQGGMGGMGPLQLTLRPPGPQLVAVSSSSGSTPLLNALSSPAITTQSGQTTRGPSPQTIVIGANQPGPTGLSIAGARGAGQNQTLFLTPRPPVPFGMGNQTPMFQSGPAGPQFIQIQTPNGPLLVALQATPSLQSNPPSGAVFSSGPNTSCTFSFSSNHHSLLQSSPQGPATLQTILNQGNQDQQTPGGQLILSSHGLLSSNHQHQPNSRHNQSPSPTQGTKGPAKSVNLADLLKETGILPESSPPSSPSSGGGVHQTRLTPQISDGDSVSLSNTNNNSNLPQDTQAVLQTHQPQTLFMVPSGVQNQNIQLLTQPHISSQTTPQLRLALAPDGSVVLQPSIQTSHLQSIQPQIISESITSVPPKTVDSLKDTCGPGSSQPSPDSTTPTFDAALPTPTSSASSSKSHVDQPKIPASSKSSDVKIKTEKDDDELRTEDVAIPTPVEKINSTNDGQRVKSNSDDTRTKNSPSPAAKPIMTTSGSHHKTSSDNNTSDSNNKIVAVAGGESCPVSGGDGMSGGVQISVNNQEFLERLENQIKGMMSIENPNPQQKQMLSELQNLHKTITEAKRQNQTSQSSSSSDSNKVNIAAQQTPTSVNRFHDSSSSSPLIQTPQCLVASNTQLQQNSSSSVQLVNLLKPNHSSQPVNPTQIRLLPPAVAATPTVSSSTTTFQVGNQLITISTPTKTTPTAASLQPQPQIATTTPALFQVVRLQPPTVTTTVSTSTTSVTTISPSTKSVTVTKIVDPQVEKDKLRLRTLKLFQQQLTADQNSALKPDTKTPFRSKRDAVQRLLRYHVYQKPSPPPEVLEKIEQNFESISKDLIFRKEQLFDRFRRVLLRQSWKDTNAEVVMLDKLFVDDETNALKFDREVVAQGIPLDLPPPPESWRHEIVASIAAEEEREMFSRKRKLPFLDEDLSEHLAEVKRPDNDYCVERDSGDETEDEDSDSDDDDEGNHEADDIAKYLGPNENGSGNLSDLNSLYGDVNYDQTSELNSDLADFDERSNPTDLLYDGLSSTGHHQDWRSSSFGSSGMNIDTRHGDVWSSRLPEAEAAVAVESILTSEDEDDNQLSVDLTAINSLDGLSRNPLENDEEDDDEDEEEEDEDDEEEDGDMDEDDVPSQSYLPDSSSGDVQLQPDPNPCDVQMQCAIDSILEMPVHQNNPTPPFYGSSHTGYGNRYDHMSGHHHHRSSGLGMSSYHPGQMSDPVLDEAVKSILS